MSTDPSQQHIWSHFQAEGSLGVFGASHVRHAAILRKIARISWVAQPTVLNVGIGDGNFERQAVARGWIVHALDPEPGAVWRLRGERVDAKAGTFDAMPFADETFDAPWWPPRCWSI